MKRLWPCLFLLIGNESEVLHFLKSEWCGMLLSCQSAVTQERIESAAMAVLRK